MQQLSELKSAIVAFMPVVSEVATLQGSVAAFQGCLAEIDRLLSEGFCQDDLNVLSRAVPRVFWLHKEWTPELERMVDGRYREPWWFVAADKLHQRVQEAAEELKIVGRY
ncbi:hypothetical protein DB032_14665 [Chromobacterium sp. Panama]|nr:hypothetical protein DB032_14665 [Chromobacterium sp. Panama]